MAFQEIRQVPSTPAKNGIKPWKKPSSLLHSHLLWAHTWWDTSQILSAFMISSHSSQQPCCSSMWLSVSHNGNNSFRNLKGSKRPPEFTQTATKVMYQLFRLVQELLRQAQCTRDPATKSTQPTTRRLERSRVGTWVFGIRHLLTGLKWSSAVIAGDFGLPAMFFFFLSELNTDTATNSFKKVVVLHLFHHIQPQLRALHHPRHLLNCSVFFFQVLTTGVDGVQGNICKLPPSYFRVMPQHVTSWLPPWGQSNTTAAEQAS